MRKLIVLGAVAFSPAWCFSASQAELDVGRDKAIAWLVKNQQADGRWSSGPGLDVVTTASAVEALAAAGVVKLPAFAAGVAWLQNAEAGSTDALARQVMALGKAGAPIARDRLASRLVLNRNSTDKGWGSYPGYLSSIPDTPLAMLALQSAGVSISDVSTIAAAFDASRYVAAGQKFWLHQLTGPATRREGAGEHIVPTALSMLALKGYGLSSTSLSEAVAFLKSRQASSGANQGGFAGADGLYSPMDAALAGEALVANSTSGRADAAVQAALDFLKRTQGSAGNWGDTLSTAAALKFIATSSTAVVDTDGDGIPDAIEAHLGTDPNRADSKQLALTNTGTSAIPEGGSAAFSVWGIRGRPMDARFKIADAQTCCTTLSGSLPTGISLTTSGSPITVKIAGTPTVAGSHDAHFSYKTAAGIEKQFELRVDIDPTIFRAAPDPFNLGTLFTDVGLNKLKGAWQATADDFNRDGRTDFITYFSGANEVFNRLNCSGCTPYAGPNWGQMVGFQDVNGSLARVEPLSANVKFTGDVRNIYVLDFNNDGKRDLVLNLNRVSTTSTSPADLSAQPFRSLVALRNDSPDGGLLTFTDVTTALKIDTAPEGVVVVLDVNRDGFADYVVSNGAANAKLYVYNAALGHYEDRSSGSGLTALNRPQAVDYDGDGLIDIVSIDTASGIRFFRNKGDRTFAAVANASSLPALASRRINRIVPADLNNDSRPELVLFETATIGAGASEAYAGSRVTVLDHGGIDAAMQPSYTERPSSPLTDFSSHADAINLGGVVLDVDDDGLLDILVAARDPNATAVENAVFKQQADSTFVKIVAETGLPVGVTAFDSPIAIDLDGDHKADLFWPNSSNTAYRLINEGNENRSLDLELRGKASNRGALGAIVQVSAWGVTQTRQVLSLHANASRLHFGLGGADTATVTIKWPDGSLQSLDITQVDRLVTVTQP